VSADALRRRVDIVVFDAVEVLDFAGPFEVFSVASELHGQALFDVRLIAADAARPVRAVNGLRVVPDAALDAVGPPDVLVVPGGFGTRAFAADAGLVAQIARLANGAEATLGICTSLRILAAAGLLDGQQVTTHHELVEAVPELAPAATLLPGARYTDNGRLLTAAGISAGIDASLHLVARLCGMGVAEATARYMEYDWRQRQPARLALAEPALGFRSAGAADIPMLVDLVTRAYRGESSRAGWTTEADLLEGQRIAPDVLAADIARPHSHVLVAERDGEPVACAHVAIESDAAYFGMFAVQPGLQGQGIGDAVLAQAEHMARTDLRQRHLRMTVIDLRQALIHWYERRGYRRTGVHKPFPYGDERFGRPLRDDLRFEVLEKAL